MGGHEIYNEKSPPSALTFLGTLASSGFLKFFQYILYISFLWLQKIIFRFHKKILFWISIYLIIIYILFWILNSKFENLDEKKNKWDSVIYVPRLCYNHVSKFWFFCVRNDVSSSCRFFEWSTCLWILMVLESLLPLMVDV